MSAGFPAAMAAIPSLSPMEKKERTVNMEGFVSWILQDSSDMDKSLQNRVISLLLPYQPSSIGIFGSYAKGENRKDSDLDILIRFKERLGVRLPE